MLRAFAWVLVLGALAPAIASGAAITDTPFGQTPAQRLAAVPAIPDEFSDSVAFSGLSSPVAVRFAADGTAFVAEKRGIVKRYSGVGDATAEIVADVRAPTHDFWDRGLIGLAVDPSFPARPYIYISYTWDVEQRWADTCPTPPGATDKGCVVDARIARINVNTGAETVLLAGQFCQQFPSHSIGGLAFGADGALYASSGDGASFNYADERPTASRVDNPCGDPFKEGGSLRSQDLRTSADPAGLDGSILRLDPDTGAAASGNPRGASADANERRIVAQGLRNPFRIAVRPGTSEVWSADVGASTWEEINRHPNPVSSVRNFGWPCYEGVGRQGAWDALNNPICEALYAEPAGAHTAPHYTYSHSARVVAGETCPTGTSSISGLAFYDGGTFPAEYDGALFFADYARRCVWAMLRGDDGLPDRTKLRTFVTSVAAVDVQVGPGGALFYVDIAGNTVRRVRALNGNQAPTARVVATPDRGPAPLAVTLDARGSTDPDGTPLAFAWDLDGDGAYDDSAEAAPSWTYTASGVHTARVRARDASGLDDTAEVTIYAGIPPEARILAPAASTSWTVGDALAFSGAGNSATGAPLAADKLSWELLLHHCPQGGCHVHAIRTWQGTASDALVAPDHEYPSHLELRLTATDAGLSASASRLLLPRTVALRVATEPPGLEAFLGTAAGPSPLEAEVIVGSTTSLGVATPQEHAGRTWAFTGWPLDGSPARELVAPATPTTYTAAFAAAPAPTPTPEPTPEPTPTPDPGPGPVGTPPPAPRGPVAAWGFDGASGPRLHGARRVAAGRHGAGLALDGAGDSATVAAAGALGLRSGFTLEAWVRPARGGGRAPIVVGERARSTAFALGGRPAGTAWRISARSLRADARLRPGRWTHVALVWDRSALRLHVDGRFAGERWAPPDLGRRIARLRLGGDRAAGAWLRGRLDDVRVYDRPLDAGEIAADMRAAVR